jgi:hypothetical protein
VGEGKARYKVIEPTFEVEGGTPAQALEFVLNQQAEEGYRLRACVPVRGAKDGQADSQAVTVMVLERIEV